MIELLEDRLTPSLDSPIDVDSAPNIVDENAAVGTVVGITAYSANPDPEQGDVGYALAPGSPFVIEDSLTGIVTVGSSGVDYESSGGSYTIQIYAYHGADSSNQTFTIYVNNLAPSAPEDVWTAPNAVDENTAGGALVGISLGNSVDPAGGTVTYVLSDTAGGRFTLDFDNRIIVAEGADLDYESSGGHYTVKAKAYDGDLYSAEATFTINIGNVGEGSISGRIWYDADLDGIQGAGEPGVANERVFLWLDANYYVEANTGAGGGYTFTGVADGSYTIQLYTYAEETSPQDQGSDDTLDSDLTALVTMSGEAAITHVDGGERYALSLSDPSDSDSADNVIAEDAADNTAVGITVVSADPPFTPLVYALTDDAGGRFQIDAASGVVTVKSGSLIDYESSGGSYTIWAKASYGPFSSNAVAFTINVTNLAPATPTDSDGTANEIDENPTNGTLVGITAASSDPHGGTVTFILTDDAGGRFQIDPDTGAVSVKDGTLLDYETTTSHVIKIKATDGNLESAEASFTIGINDVNDPPINSLPDAQTTDEDTPLLFDSAYGDALGVSDVDTSVLTVSLTVFNGLLTIANVAHLTVSGNGTPSVTLTGDQSYLNSALTGFTYTPNAGFFGDDSLDMFTVDPGDSSSFDIDTLTITVAPVNNPPVGADNTVSLLEDDFYVFSSADFGFGDPNDSPADDFLAVQIVTVPDNGILTNAGVALSAGDYVSVANIDAGKLIFTAAHNANGAALASFTFAVQDDGGGTDQDPWPDTITIDVDPVNDAPSFLIGPNKTVSLNAGAQTFSGWATGIDAGAADESGQTLNFVVVSNSNTSLFSAGPAISSSGALTFTPTANVSGKATIVLELQDDGGTANGGADTSPTQTFIITVLAPSSANESINLRTDSDGDNDIDDDDDPVEEDMPGRIINYNGDDDNENLTPDRDETTAAVDNEDDLVPIYLDVSGDDLTNYTITITAPAGVKLWDAPDKEVQIPSGSVFVYGTQPSVIYAEGVDAGDGKGQGMVAALLQDAAANPVAVDQVRVNVVRFDLDVNNNRSLDDPVDGFFNYLPGYEGNMPRLNPAGVPFRNRLYGPQRMELILEGLGSASGIAAVQFDIVASTRYAGFAENATNPAIEEESEGGLPGYDYSFSALGNALSKTVLLNQGDATGDIELTKAWTRFYNKDYGGAALVRVQAFSNNNVLRYASTIHLPLDLDNDYLADKWELEKYAEWTNQYGTNPYGILQFWSLYSTNVDSEEADADGVGNGDGGTDLVAHLSEGDGFTPFQEYRGYVLDGGGFDGGGANGHSGGHKRLSPAYKEYLWEVDVMANLTNPPPGGVNAVLETAAKAFSDRERGAGIRVFWVFDELNLPHQTFATTASVDTFVGSHRNASFRSAGFVHVLLLDDQLANTDLGWGGGAPAAAVIFFKKIAGANPGADHLALAAKVVAHEATHLILNEFNSSGFDSGEHTIDPNENMEINVIDDLTRDPDDLTDIMYRFQIPEQSGTLRWLTRTLRRLNLRSKEGVER